MNTLVPTDSPLCLESACSINDKGEIIGFEYLKSNPNESHAYLGKPVENSWDAKINFAISRREEGRSDLASSLTRQTKLDRPHALVWETESSPMNIWTLVPGLTGHFQNSNCCFL